MSANPFRSHLLQQWAKSSQGRAPAAVIPWLKAPSSSEKRSSSTEGTRRSTQKQWQYHHEDGDVSDMNDVLSLSTCESTSHQAIELRRSNQESSNATISLREYNQTTNTGAAAMTSNRTKKVSSSLLVSSFYTHDHPHLYSESNLSGSTKNQNSANHQFQRFHSSVAGQNVGPNSDGQEQSLTQNLSHLDQDSISTFQSILMSRRTATRLKDDSDVVNSEEENKESLLLPLGRAVRCAQMAPNHKRTEAFSFRRFLAGSQAAKSLANISYEVTLRKSGSEPNANAKRRKWLQIPAFLVALAHDNQSQPSLVKNKNSESDFAKGIEKDDDDEKLFAPLSYTPPETERQLEDYAAASAAVQNVLLSLHAEGIGSKWATGPVIQTQAFRNLVNAKPTDRVVALIMVGGSTEYGSKREEHITSARRQRRRPFNGDFMIDLA